jgi:hypothetical protein
MVGWETLISNPVRTGQDPQPEKGLAAMSLLVLLVFLVLLAVASAAGLTTDSRDGADWTPSVDGRRQPNHPSSPM